MRVLHGTLVCTREMGSVTCSLETVGETFTLEHLLSEAKLLRKEVAVEITSGRLTLTVAGRKAN